MDTLERDMSIQHASTKHRELDNQSIPPLQTKGNMKFQHFLITQFNLKKFWATEDHNHKKWLNWTVNRIDLFQKYCLPSVINQVNQNFKWFIFLDRTTPSSLIDKLLALTPEESPIQWCLVDGYDDFKSHYMDHIRATIQPGIEWIVTTNLDNDDALHKEAIDIIQNYVIPVDNHLISLTNGYCMDLKSRQLSQYFYPRSPFLSLIEKNGEHMKGIHHRNHTKWEHIKLHFYHELLNRIRRKKDRYVTYLMTKPLWIQVVHQQNVSNSLYRGVPVNRSLNLVDFGIPQYSRKMELEKIFRYRSYYLWKRYVFCKILQLFPPPKDPVFE